MDEYTKKRIDIMKQKEQMLKDEIQMLRRTLEESQRRNDILADIIVKMTEFMFASKETEERK